jgi:Fic/DOC family
MKSGFDTRRAHRFFFFGLTPSDCTCIIGKYRGDATCPELQSLQVGIQTDSRVGIPFWLVEKHMIEFERSCDSALAHHQTWLQNKGKNVSQETILLNYLVLMALLLQKFLTIHPYMDGNGHMGRLLVYALLVKAGFDPVKWDIDAKQPSKYSEAIRDHRSGKTRALEQFLLSVIG